MLLIMLRILKGLIFVLLLVRSVRLAVVWIRVLRIFSFSVLVLLVLVPAILVMVPVLVVFWLPVSRVRLLVRGVLAVLLFLLMLLIMLRILKGLIFVLRLVRSVRLAVVWIRVLRIYSPSVPALLALAPILIVMVRVLVVIFPVSRRAVLVRGVPVRHLPVPVLRSMRILTGTVLGTVMSAMGREPAGETIRAVQGLLPRAAVPVREPSTTVRPVLILLAPAGMPHAAATPAEIQRMPLERTAEESASPATARGAA
jgi:hypothetical protein